MKRSLIILCATLCGMSLSAQQGFDHTAPEIAARMGIAWNLGNTLEAGGSSNNFTNKGGLGAETSWQKTKTSQEVIDFVKSQGFNAIRIPCAWIMGHINDATTYEIDAEWMARVKEVVDYCVKDDLYVMLNQHWDGGWLENNIKDDSKKEKNKLILEAVWTQIAEAFKDYDEHVLFAGLNEPNAENQKETDNLIEYEQVFVNAVRATGGNNMYRTLIVQGPSTNIEHTYNYYKSLPVDPAGEGKLMMEVHYYNPWQFWGMEKDESWGKVFYYWGKENHQPGSSHNPNWDCEESAMEKQLDMMVTKYVSKGVPVVIGEFGANWRDISKLSGESQDKHDASIRLHYYLLTKFCLERGLVPTMWDTNYCNRPSMTIIDRENLKIYNSLMMDAINQAREECLSIEQPSADVSSRQGRAYDLMGHPVNPAQKLQGLYIVNGKKVCY